MSYQFKLDVNVRGDKKDNWYLHMIKQVNYPSSVKESTVLWVCERYKGSTIQISWNSNYQLFYTKNKPEIGAVVIQNSSYIASIGASYTWDGKQFSFSGASNTPGAIQVWNRDRGSNPQEYFGISQSPDVISSPTTIEVGYIPTCVAAAKKAESKEFIPTYYCTLWLSHENTRPRTVVAIPRENTTTVVVVPTITTTITLTPPKKIRELSDVKEDKEIKEVKKEEAKVGDQEAAKVIAKEETKVVKEEKKQVKEKKQKKPVKEKEKLVKEETKEEEKEEKQVEEETKVEVKEEEAKVGVKEEKKQVKEKKT